MIVLTRDLGACRALRRAVFVEEQGVPEAIEFDSRDNEAIHFLAFAGALPAGRIGIEGPAGLSDVDPAAGGKVSSEGRFAAAHPEAQAGQAQTRAGQAQTRAVGTARLTLEGADAKLGHLCVLAPCRGRGLGLALIEAAAGETRRRGLARLRLTAQLPAVPFYIRLGFTADGPERLIAGRPHLDMARPP